MALDEDRPDGPVLAGHQPAKARRILVYGVTGSGKTTLAAAIAARTGLPWHAVDELTWEPNWCEVSTSAQRDQISKICLQRRWILDSGYSGWIDIVLNRVDLVVCLDYPRWRSLGRLLRRTVVRIVDREPICNGNVETIRTALSRDSIIAWHFRSFSRKRRRMREWAAGGIDARVVLINSPRAARRWIASLTAESDNNT